MGFPDLIRLRYNAFQFFETVLVSMDVVCKEMAVGVHDFEGMSCSIVGVGKSVPCRARGSPLSKNPTGTNPLS